MIGGMGSAVGSDAVAGRVARPGVGGIVSRPRLFERLGASARVTVVSAPPGAGKTVLLRSWISQATSNSVRSARGPHVPHHPTMAADMA